MKPNRLVVSIYLVALVQLLAAWLGFSLSQQYLIEPPGRVGQGGWEVFAAQHVAFDRRNAEALHDTMDWLRVELGIRVTLFEPDGRVIASNHATVPAPLKHEQTAVLPIRNVYPGDDPDTYVVGIHEDDKLVAYVVTDRFRFKRPVSKQVLLAVGMLGVVLLGSLAFARSLARPLRRLAQAARAFGRGDLAARVRLKRTDELGEVANAFDDMADRITTLLQSQRELLANVSHELRTPLARIRVALDLAAEGDADAIKNSLAYITADWGDLERLVEDVLATARLDLGSAGYAGPALRSDSVDLTQLVQGVLDRYQIVYPREVLEVDIDAAVPRIQGDGGLLRRVLDNLIDNARKYSDAGNSVKLSIVREDQGVCITVEDHGMGIDAKDLPHIFTPFFRADRSRNRKTGGVGIGLTLVRRIVSAHGGRIEVESVVGKGSHFRVHLPFRLPVAAPSESSELRAA